MNFRGSAAETDVIRHIGPPGCELVPPDRFPQIKRNEIALMFSGGIDSTATAIMLTERYERIHLVTYRNGYGHYYHHRTQKRVDELNRALGNRFVHTLISTKSYFDEITVNNVLADYRQYRSGFIWFMGCKMAMHMRSAIYCMENGLRFMTDGSNEDTNEMVEQMLISLTLIRFFYEQYGIHFGTPVYEVRRDASRQLIKKLGIKMGVQVMDRHLCIQPTCIAGELYYMPYLLFNKRVRHDEETVARFIDEKKAICDRIVRRYFERQQVDVDALIADRMTQIATQDAAVRAETAPRCAQGTG
jgi:hypothetical protein